MRFQVQLELLKTALALLDYRLRQTVTQFRERRSESFDQFRGLYVSDRQVDSILAKNGNGLLRVQKVTVNSTERQQNFSGAGALAEESTPLWRRQWLDWLAKIEAERRNGRPFPFSDLVHEFNLSSVEAFVILLTLAPELSLHYKRLFAYLHDDVRRTCPSVDLALDLWCHTVAENVQLRSVFQKRSRLIKSRLLLRFNAESETPSPTLLSSYLRLAPAVVEYLLGHTILDDRLANCATLLFPVDSHERKAWPTLDFMRSLEEARQRVAKQHPRYIFIGERGLGRSAAARCLAQQQGRPLLQVSLSRLAKQFDRLEDGLQIVMRDGRLAQAFLYVEAGNRLAQSNAPIWLSRLFTYPYSVIISSEVPWYGEQEERKRPLFQIRFPHPTSRQRLRLWQNSLAARPATEDLKLSLLASQFSFTPRQIEATVQTAYDRALRRDGKINEADLLVASRAHSQQGLCTLAVQISPQVAWGDLIVPDKTEQMLRQIVNRVRHKITVFGEWNWAQKAGRNQGLFVLFQGKPGTGKTMAAEVIAHQLGCDLYQVDLSLVVSKYIGETEKHLNQVFRLAAQSNAVLFFDEADALFGKRSHVRDSHDRYANMEISYLLQRMEQHDGLVILATNLGANMDPAFTRRLHITVTFPLPDEASRERIWATTFPTAMPLAPDVDFALLARRFPLTGGNIRNIMLQAAFLAADAGEEVTLAHIMTATQQEYRKLGLMAEASLFDPENEEALS
jgi:SpoVK/Ycf46/Vps4 family AAA+-type ATPase